MTARLCIPRVDVEPTLRISDAKHVSLPKAHRLVGLSEVLMTSALSVPMVQSPLSRNPIRHVRFGDAGGVDP
jgi:hypothetical protein